MIGMVIQNEQYHSISFIELGDSIQIDVYVSKEMDGNVATTELAYTFTLERHEWKQLRYFCDRALEHSEPTSTAKDTLGDA
jgi:hypothetical protein